MKRDDLIREVMSMQGVGYQIAKSIVKLAEQPVGEVRKVGPKRRHYRKPMLQHEAAAIVDAARRRVHLVDSTG